tara:strand:- start:319 stop:579 length:261 start_codon:yes stop_codon:yes gene_type:complete
MIDTDKYENMRQLFRDFIDTADEDTEDAWKNKLTMLDELLAEVKRLLEENALLASQIRLAYEWVEAFHNEDTMISFIEHVYGDEEE